MTHFKGGAKAKLGDYWLSTERNIEDAVAFTRPKTGTTGEGDDKGWWLRSGGGPSHGGGCGGVCGCVLVCGTCVCVW